MFREKIGLLEVHGYAGKGGGVVHSYMLVRGLIRSGKFRVVVARPPNEFYLHNKALIDVGAEIVEVNLKEEKSFFTSIFRLVEIINSKKLEIIHCHHKNAIIIGSLAGMITSKPVVAVLHGLPSERANGIRFRDRFLEFILSLALRYRVKKIVCISRFVENINRKLLHIPPGKTRVIYNGIDFSRVKPHYDKEMLKKYFGISRNRKVITTIGRLNIQKGMHYFIEIANIIVNKIGKKEVLFLVVGDGKLMPVLAEKVERYRLSDFVKFVGYVEEISKIYGVTDILVSLSVDEGFGRTPLEAMINGIPVVAFASGAIPEIVSGQEVGYLVDYGDVEMASMRILELLENDKKRQKFSKNAIRHAAWFSEERFVKEYVEFLEEVIGET